MRVKPYPYYEMPEIPDFAYFVKFMRENYSGKPAFVFEEDKEYKEVTYDKFTDDIDALSSYFRKTFPADTKVALFGENSYEWVVTYFAAVVS